MNMIWDKYTLKETLRDGVFTVVFEKVDVTLREMQCTLNKEIMPPQLLTEEQNAAKVRTENDDVLSVWSWNRCNDSTSGF